MTINDAMQKEIARGLNFIAATKDAPCHVCGNPDELRAGVCFFCKEKVETDMIEVWETFNPQNRWPYMWRGQEFIEVTDQEAVDILDAVEKRLK